LNYYKKNKLFKELEMINIREGGLGLNLFQEKVEVKGLEDRKEEEEEEKEEKEKKGVEKGSER
jgi:hypothetical protein